MAKGRSYLDTSAQYQKAKPGMRGMSAGDSNQISDDTIAQSRRIISALLDTADNEKLYRKWTRKNSSEGYRPDIMDFETFKAREEGSVAEPKRRQLRDAISSYASKRAPGERVDGTTKDSVILSEETIDNSGTVKVLDQLINEMMAEKTNMETGGAEPADIERFANNLNYLIMQRNKYSPGKKADIKATPTTKKPVAELIKKPKVE